MADSETPAANKQSKLKEEREARRKRILENAQARLDKLKGLQPGKPSDQSPPLDQPVQSPVDEPTVSFAPPDPQPSVLSAPSNWSEVSQSPVVDNVSPTLASDPPDEIVPRPPTPQQAPPIAPPPVQPAPRVNLQARLQVPSSWLSIVVGDICSPYGYKLRTAAALICVLIVTIGNFAFGKFRMSYVLSILILDFTLTLWLVWRPGPKFSTANPLGWWSMAYLPLSFLHPSLPRLFETGCLIVMLLNAFLRDILFVVFSSVISVACIYTVM